MPPDPLTNCSLRPQSPSTIILCLRTTLRRLKIPKRFGGGLQIACKLWPMAAITMILNNFSPKLKIPDRTLAVSYALRWQGAPELIMSYNRKTVTCDIERWDVFVWLPSHRSSGVSMLPESSVCFE